MEIKVCIGSACHLKGSYEVIEKLKNLLAADGIDHTKVLKGSFCLGNCGDHVTMSVDGEIIDVLPETVEQVYNEKIKGRV